MFEYGITADLLEEKDYKNLISIGSAPALIKYKDIYRNQSIKIAKLNKNIEELKKENINFNLNAYSGEERLKTYARLFVIKERIGNMPFRCLINPNIGKSLNNKISQVSYDVKIRDLKKSLKAKNFDIDGINFGTRDVNQIRQSIIFLNQFMQNSQPSKIKHQCLSKDAQKVFIERGFEGLYKIAKKNKLQLRKIFKNSSELKNRYFYEYASNELGFKLKTFSKLEKSRLSLAIETLYWDGIKGYDNYPIYFIYNEKMDIQKLDLLRRGGYTRMKHIKALDTDNQNLYDFKEIYRILFEAFGDYSE